MVVRSVSPSLGERADTVSARVPLPVGVADAAVVSRANTVPVALLCAHGVAAEHHGSGDSGEEEHAHGGKKIQDLSLKNRCPPPAKKVLSLQAKWTTPVVELHCVPPRRGIEAHHLTKLPI